MPIYEYQCTNCNHQLEALQKMSDDPLQDCPACEQADLKKLVSAAAFRLKGSGWYETDFKTGNKKQLAESDSSSSSSSAGAKKADKAESASSSKSSAASKSAATSAS